MLRVIIVLATLSTIACHQPVAAPELPLEQIIERHISALGGEPALQRIKSRRINAIISGLIETGTMTTYVKPPNKILIVMKIGSRETITGYDGTVAWIRDAQGVRQLSGGHVDRLKSSIALDDLLGCRAVDCGMNLIGVEPVDSHPCYVLQLIWRGGRQTMAFISSQNFHLIKTVSSIKAPTSGESVSVETRFSDFRNVGDIVVPFSMSVNGKYGKYRIMVSSYELNVHLDDSMFQAPES